MEDNPPGLELYAQNAHNTSDYCQLKCLGNDSSFGGSLLSSVVDSLPMLECFVLSMSPLRALSSEEQFWEPFSPCVVLFML